MINSVDNKSNHQSDKNETPVSFQVLIANSTKYDEKWKCTTVALGQLKLLKFSLCMATAIFRISKLKAPFAVKPPMVKKGAYVFCNGGHQIQHRRNMQ